MAAFSHGVRDFRPDIFVADVLLIAMGLWCVGRVSRWAHRHYGKRVPLLDLLAVLTIAGITFAVLGKKLNDSRRDRVIVTRLATERGVLEDECWTMSGPTWLRECVGESVFGPLDRVISIDLRPQIDRRKHCIREMELVTKLTRLRRLDLLCGQLTYRELQSLSKLRSLEAICMDNVHIYGQPAPFPNCTALRGLNIRGTAHEH